MAIIRGAGGGFVSDDDREEYLSGGKTTYQDRSTPAQPQLNIDSGVLGAQIGQMGFDPNYVTPKVNDAGMGGGNLTPQDVYQQKMTLAEQLAAEQRRLAETQARYKRESLADQLANQRRQYAQQLASMNEQMFGQGNKLLEGLAGRGLATSGLLQLGDVQSQMAKGQGLSDLAYQDRLAREGLSQQEGQVRSDLFNALRQAELDKAGYETGALEQLYSMQQSEQVQAQQQSYNTLQQIYSAVELLQNPNIDDNTRSLLMNAIGLAEQGNVGALQEILTSPEMTDLVGADMQQALLGASGFDEKLMGGTNFDNTQKVVIGGKDYYIDANNPQKFNTDLQQVYDTSGLKYAGEGLITIDAARTGAGTIIRGGMDWVKDLPFVTPDGKRFKTWNDAAAHLDEIRNPQQE